MFQKYHQKFWHRTRKSREKRDFSKDTIDRIDAKIATYEDAHQKKLMDAFEIEFAKL